jgi:hypothetical protein
MQCNPITYLDVFISTSLRGERWEPGAFTTIQPSIVVIVVIVSFCCSLHGAYEIFSLTLLCGKSLP